MDDMMELIKKKFLKSIVFLPFIILFFAILVAVYHVSVYW